MLNVAVVGIGGISRRHIEAELLDKSRTKIVAKSELYYQNISINNIKKHFPDYFIISSKGILINMKNVDKIDWNTNYVYFKDGMRDYVVSKSHKKEIDNYGNN